MALLSDCFPCDFGSGRRLTQSLSFLLLSTNSSTTVVLHFPSHRVLADTNLPPNTNSPLLSHHLQSEQAVLFLFSPSFLIPSLCLHLPSLPLLIFLPLALLPASLRHTRVSLSFGSEGWDERRREAREERGGRM